MSKSRMVDVVSALAHASEKAAIIARACCGYGPEALIVAQKEEGEANTRFDQDFKTIADVLAQVCAKCEIEKRCKGLVENVRGEEHTELGGIVIEIKETEEQTAELLGTLVPMTIAMRMANAVHRDVYLDDFDEVVPSDFPDIDPADIGVWIDPIDATAQFIAGVAGKAKADEGLNCVTVLIGSYLKSTGEPLFGIINQPFYNCRDQTIKSRMVWGLCYGDVRKWGNSDSFRSLKSNKIYISTADPLEQSIKIQELGWDVEAMPGAGNKLLKIATDEAIGYVLAKPTTYRWDMCAGHSVLRAKGGDILDFVTKQPLTYNDPEGLDTQAYCNSGGVIAFSNYDTYEKLKPVFET